MVRNTADGLGTEASVKVLDLATMLRSTPGGIGGVPNHDAADIIEEYVADEHDMGSLMVRTYYEERGTERLSRSSYQRAADDKAAQLYHESERDRRPSRSAGGKSPSYQRAADEWGTNPTVDEVLDTLRRFLEEK